MKKYGLVTLIVLILAVFIPSATVFFSADDWFHLRVSDINTLDEFINFFSFSGGEQSISFYRPLSTQVFFFVFEKLFGLNPIPYHLFVLACFGVLLFLITRLTKKIGLGHKKSLLAVVLYGFSVSNFTRLYFLSAFQEVALVIFSLLCIISYLDEHKARSWIFFILALLSKETAVILPLIIFFISWEQKKIKLDKLLPFLVIFIPYLYLRLFWFGLAVGDTYTWDFSPIKGANTLMWYVLWSIGAPELLVDYIGSGFQPIARFFTDFPRWWYIIFGALGANLLLGAVFIIKCLKKIDRKFTTFIILFLISLLPVIFLPQHKFALELGLPLVWFCLILVTVLPQRGRWLFGFLFVYLSLNLSMNYLTYTRHSAIGRAKIAHSVYRYFATNYPKAPADQYFEFVNDTNDYGAQWGSSKQIANSIGGSELFRVLYGDADYEVFFEDILGIRPALTQKIPISTKMFYQ